MFPYLKQRQVVHFRRWTRKPYAVFNSLGRVIRIGVLLYTLSILTKPSRAQQTDSLLIVKTFPDDEVVITAQRVPVLASQASRPLGIMVPEIIQPLAISTPAEALDMIPGADVRQRGAPGTQADISLRGGSFDQSLVLLNGINLTNPQTGHHSFDLPLSPWWISRIEVLRGPAARVWGSNAFTGAVNVSTPYPTHNRTEIRVQGGQNSLFSFDGSLMGRRKKWGWFAGLNHQNHNGFAPNTDANQQLGFGRLIYQGKSASFEMQGGISHRAFGANSFQLSYLAVLGIVSLQPGLYHLIHIKNKILDKVWALLTVSIAAQLATGPLATFYFHQFPSYFLLTNLWVIPVSFVCMFLGVLFFLTSWIYPLAKITGWVLALGFKVMNTGVSIIEGLPGAVIKGLYPDIFLCVGIYGFLIFLVLYFYFSRKWLFYSALVLILAISARKPAQWLFCRNQAGQIVVAQSKSLNGLILVKGRSVALSDAKMLGDKAMLDWLGDKGIDNISVLKKHSCIQWNGRIICVADGDSIVKPLTGRADYLFLLGKVSMNPSMQFFFPALDDVCWNIRARDNCRGL